MKKILRCFIAVFIIFAAACFIPALSDLSGGIKASAITSGNFYLEQYNKDSLCIVSYIGNDSPSSLTLPSSVNGKKVLFITNDALSNVKSSLKTLKIPGSIKYIGAESLRNLPELVKVEFTGNGLETIEKKAFMNCPKLTSINLPSTLKTIGEYAFHSCSSLRSIVIPDGVTMIDSNAFENCKNLSSITIPKNIKDFGFKAFENTAWIKAKRSVYSSKLVIVNGILLDASESTNASITLPSSLKAIASFAYNSNDYIESVVIPSGCTSIGLAAFTFCRKLENVTIPSTVAHIGGNAFDETKWLKTQQKKSPFVVINNILINGDACTGNVTIPTNVTKIGEWAFSQNRDITSLTIPANVKSMEKRAFGECSSLKTVKIANGLTGISEKAFDYCKELVSVNIPSTVKSIGMEAFNCCSSLKSIVIPNSVSVIDAAAFYRCSGLTSLALPTTACRIGTCAFGYCSSLTSLTIPGKITFADVAQFIYLDSLTSLTIQDGVKNIPDSAFLGCNKLKSLRLPNTLRTIDCDAFSECSLLEYLDIPSSVESIGDYAFNGSTSLRSVKIRANTKKIGENVFSVKNKFPMIICSRNSAAEKYAKTNGHSVSYFEISTRRFYGNTRYGTATVVADKTYPNGCKNIVIASGSQYADALAGVTLANKLDAPILLSTPSGLDNTTIARIKALKPKKAYILGGTGAVPDSVASQLGKFGISTVRLAGSDRYKTAVSIAKQVASVSGKSTQTLFAVCATSFPDALSASAAAAVNSAPIIYINPNGTIDASTGDYLKSVKSSLKHIYIVGGEKLVPEAAVKSLRSYCSAVERISGANRYSTSAAVNEKFIDMFDNNRVCVVTGQDFPDALTAGVHAAKTRSALILADQSLVMETKKFLIKKCPMLITAVGGTGAVPNDILNKMVAVVKSGW